MIAAVENLVRGKYAMDARLGNYKDADKITRAMHHLSGLSVPHPHLDSVPSINPSTFIKRALPFSDIQYSYERAPVQSIDPFLVIGGTYKDYAENQEAATAIVNRMNEAAEEYEKGGVDSNIARYCKIGDLPVYVACEGKNRVLMFQRMNSPIKATVTLVTYPQPEELTLHLVKPYHFYALSCSNPKYKNQRSGVTASLAILPFQELVIPLLKAYGVKEGGTIYSLTAIVEWFSQRRSITGALMGH